MSLTKGELLELIKDLPDDTKVISASTNFEMGGQLVDGRVHVDNEIDVCMEDLEYIKKKYK